MYGMAHDVISRCGGKTSFEKPNCPTEKRAMGCGHVLVLPWGREMYTGYRQLGYILFAGNILGILLIIPAYTELFAGISLLVKSQQFSASNPYTLINVIREHLIILDYSFGNLSQKIVRYFAIAFTISDLIHGFYILIASG